MKRASTFVSRELRRLRRCDQGVALVEFGVVLPLMLLFFALAIEGGRTFWAYQSAIAGVRDATRYLSRAIPSNACSAGFNLAPLTATITNIVRTGTDGAAIFPDQITITSVTPTLSCVAGTFRVSPAPVVTVTAHLSIAYPFSGVFTFAGSVLNGVSTTVTDSARIFGA